VLSSDILLVSVETSYGQEIYAEVSLLLWHGKRFACQRMREDWVCLISKSVITVSLPNSSGTSALEHPPEAGFHLDTMDTPLLFTCQLYLECSDS
jgi:hypothetical protein